MCIAVRKLSGAAGLAAATATLALIVPGGSSAAQTTAPKPNLTTLVAQAKQLEFQINALSEQYDGLRIQLARAQADARIAENAATPGRGGAGRRPAGGRPAGRRELHDLRTRPHVPGADRREPAGSS